LHLRHRTSQWKRLRLIETRVHFPDQSEHSHAAAQAAGLALRGFRREGDARELFRALGPERALAPDALPDLEDEQGVQLLAFVELDLGTMSRPRLKATTGRPRRPARSPARFRSTLFSKLGA
jgi:hypothetical protein